MSEHTANDREQSLAGFYGWVEKVGNKVPHPVYLFLWLLVIAFIASYVMNKLGVSVLHPTTKKVITITNMMTSKAFGEFLRNMGRRWMTFAPMLTVPICTLGLGVANHSGLLNATLKVAGASKSAWLTTLVVAFVGVNANLAGDAAFIVFPPLAALLFLSTNRNPLAGIFLAYGSVSVGFGANILVGSADASLAGMTQSAAVVFDPNFVTNPAMGWYFMFVSTFLVTFICAWICIKIVEPKLEKTGVGVAALVKAENIEYKSLSDRERKGLRVSLYTLILFFVVVAVLCLPGLPFAAPEKGSIMTGLLFKSIPTLVFLMFFLCGYAYGVVTSSIKRFGDTIPMMSKEMTTLGSFLLICFFASQFIAIFAESGIATVIAVWGGELLLGSGLPSTVLVGVFVIVIMFVNLFMGSANGKWALLSSIFVPMLMIAGINPATTQVAYRMGDGLTNNITPTLPYLAIIMGYAQEYDDRARTGTVIAYMLPFTIITSIIWILFLMVWCAIGLPMGPGYSAFL